LPDNSQRGTPRLQKQPHFTPPHKKSLSNYFRFRLKHLVTFNP
jgi:hypothetical protein